MTLGQKADTLIKKLLELTQDRKLEWTRITETRFLTYGSDDVVSVAFQTECKGHDFVIYEARYQTCDGDERVYWTDHVRLDMVDSDGKLLWRLPRNIRTHDLLSAVTVRGSNIEEALDELLEDE